MIKYIQSDLWRVAKRPSYIEDAWCLKVNTNHCENLKSHTGHLKATELWQHITDLSIHLHTYMLNIFNIKTLFKTKMNKGINES